MNLKQAFALSTVPLVYAETASAAAIAGGVDPTTGLTLLGSWVLSLVGIAIQGQRMRFSL